MARLGAASGVLVLLLAGACSGERSHDVAALPVVTASTGVEETIDPLAGQIVGSREGHGMHGYATPALQTLGGAFELIEATKGVPYTEKDLRGSWSLVYFGYMECQEACPIALKTMPRAVASLSAAGIATKAVFIDINAPRLDDMTGGMGHEGHAAQPAAGHAGHGGGNADAKPMTGPEIRRAALAKWGPEIAPGMTFLSGTRKQVIAANKAFQSRVEAAMMKNEEPIHHINHTTTIFVMDPLGRVAGLVYHSDPVQVMIDAVKALAKGEPAPEAHGLHE
jgi:cytochrome oxidase Cu insertion factor (SCO1/SenC/PrrC family)